VIKAPIGANFGFDIGDDGVLIWLKDGARLTSSVGGFKPTPEKPVATSGSLDERPRIERSTALRTRTPVITP
jgi:hypothetical protein